MCEASPGLVIDFFNQLKKIHKKIAADLLEKCKIILAMLCNYSKSWRDYCYETFSDSF